MVETGTKEKRATIDFELLNLDFSDRIIVLPCDVSLIRK